MLDHGRIVESGTHDTLVADDGRYATSPHRCYRPGIAPP